MKLKKRSACFLSKPLTNYERTCQKTLLLKISPLQMQGIHHLLSFQCYVTKDHPCHGREIDYTNDEQYPECDIGLIV
jgi:hypothetical protein